MSKKIFTALAPVAAIVAFLVIPSLAQATQAQCGSSECANGASIREQSSDFEIQFQNGITGADESADMCSVTEIQGSLTNSQGATIEGPVTKDVLTGCTHKGFTAHITSNASVAEPWKLQVQQPDANDDVVAHLDPFSGKKIEFQVQVQEFGISVAHCRYSAGSIQLTGKVQADTMTVDGSHQFTLQERRLFAADMCGFLSTTIGTFTGSVQIETNPGNLPVAVHMS